MPKPVHVELFIPSYAWLSAKLMRGVYSFAAGADWRLTATPTINFTVQTFKRTTANGFLVYALDEAVVARVAAVNRRPMVRLLGGDRVRPGIGHVGLNDVRIGELAAEHLIERRFKHFAFLGSRDDWSRHREEGFSAALRKHGIGQRPGNPAGSRTLVEWTDLTSAEYVTGWLKALPTPVAIMAANDEIAVRIIDACEELRLDVPDDVAVVGVDNNELICDFSRIKSSSVDVDLPRVGFEAAALLQRMIAGERKAAARPVSIDPRGVVVRESTDVLAIEDADVKAAIRYIREHACDGIRARDLDRHVPVARRTLEKRFRELLGRSPGDEIRAVRLRRARDLLLETDLKLVEIATRCGFEYISYLSRAFKAEFGLSPRQFREKNRLT